MANKKPLTKKRIERMEQKAKEEKRRKRNIIIISVAVLVLLVAGIVGIVIATNYEKPAPEYVAEIQLKGIGTLKVELDSKNAPKAVGKFVELAEKGVYDGVSFYQLLGGKLYGGDKNAKVAHILGEFDNGLSNEKGVISMAKSSTNSVNPALFFINLKDNKAYDKETVEFGKVVEGLNLIVDVKEDAMPTIEKVTISKK